MDINNFLVKGFFYKQDKLIFRKYLEIKRKNSNKENNDLNIIMMNPGSSKPVGIKDEENEKSWDEFIDKLVDTEIDETIIQIIKLMERCKFNYAKIVNLSDIRLSKSDYFFTMIEKCLSGECLLGNCNKTYEHSIFSNKNKHFIKNYLNPESIFIFAWGANDRLNNLIKQALNVLNEFWGENILKIGKKAKNNIIGFLHPSPHKNNEKIEWINYISNSIKNKIYL